MDVAGGRSLRSYYGDVVGLQAVAPNLPETCTDHLDATSVRILHTVFMHMQLIMLINSEMTN